MTKKPTKAPEKGGERDAVVVDAHEGLTTACGWIDFRRRDTWVETRLKGAPESPLTGPSGWSPEAEPKTHYLDPEACGRRMKFLSVDHAVATFLDEETGKLNYIGAVNRESFALILGWRLQALWHVVLPIARPGLTAAAIYLFIVAWADFVFARTLINAPELWTLTTGLASFVGEHGVDWPGLMAAGTLSMIPVFVLFVLLEPYLVSGMAAGAVK